MASFLQIKEHFSNNTATWKFSSLSESGFIPTFGQFVFHPDVTSLFSSLSESGFIPTLFISSESFYGDDHCSHLFQRVASFLHSYIGKTTAGFDLVFSSLSESGFIPTQGTCWSCWRCTSLFSSLSESGFIPTKETLDAFKKALGEFSSLSESGFIPTHSPS